MGKAVGHAGIMLCAPDSVTMPPAPPSVGLCARSGGQSSPSAAPLDHQISTQAHSDWKKSGPDLIKNYRKFVSKWRVRACTGVPTPWTPPGVTLPKLELAELSRMVGVSTLRHISTPRKQVHSFC